MTPDGSPRAAEPPRSADSLGASLHPRLSTACLITVLSAQPERRLALMQGLQTRLAAQGCMVKRLPSHALPASGPAADPLAARQPGASLAQASHAVPDGGGFTLLATEIASSAPEAVIVAARALWARSTLVLLCATGPQDGAAAGAVDTWLRNQLLAAKVSFSVLYGAGDAALAQAWQALCMAASSPLRAELPHTASSSRSWLGSCDACSDSACEHRLFSDLLARRGNA